MALRLSTGTEPSTFTLLKTAQVAALGAHKGVDITLTGTVPSDPLGKLAILFADPRNGIAEQDESNNINWTRVR